MPLTSYTNDYKEFIVAVHEFENTLTKPSIADLNDGNTFLGFLDYILMQ